jgi:hypothetical protein
MSKPACKEVLRQYCDNPTNFFNDTCKEWVGNLNEQVKNNLANKYCADSTDEWCACFTAKMPDSFKGNATKESLFRCLDPKCEGGKNPKALKPYGLTCPTSYVDCQQNDIRLELQQSGIDKATIENKCGAIEMGAPPGEPPSGGGGGGSTPPSGGGGGGSTPPAGGEKKGLSKPALYGIIGGSVGLILLIIIIVVVAMAGKKKKGGK